MEDEMASVNEIMALMRDVLRLKRTVRSGWPYYGVRDAESVADHSFGVSFLTLILVEELKNRGVEIDATKAISMAILHEIGESRITDLHLEARIWLGFEHVSMAESSAVRAVLSQIGEIGENFFKIWQEFEEGKTVEAAVVRAADKIEMMLQGLEYEAEGYRALDPIFTAPQNLKYFDRFDIFREIVDEIVAVHRKNGGVD